DVDERPDGVEGEQAEPARHVDGFRVRMLSLLGDLVWQIVDIDECVKRQGQTYQQDHQGEIVQEHGCPPRSRPYWCVVRGAWWTSGFPHAPRTPHQGYSFFPGGGSGRRPNVPCTVLSLPWWPSAVVSSRVRFRSPASKTMSLFSPIVQARRWL